MTSIDKNHYSMHSRTYTDYDYEHTTFSYQCKESYAAMCSLLWSLLEVWKLCVLSTS